MARCGCASGSCSCLITGSQGVTVSGVGSQDNPYVITGASFATSDSPTVSLSLTGTGTILDPYRIVANAHLTLDQLTDVDAPAPVAGYLLTYVTSPVPSWIAAVPQSGIPGAVLHDSTMLGDGTPSLALGVRLDPLGNIINGPSGLKVNADLTMCTSTTHPVTPFDYQRIMETDTEAFGFWMPAPTSRWRMWDTKPQSYLAKIRSDWPGTTVGQGGWERGYYMRRGAQVNAWFTIFLGGPGSNMGYGALSVDLPFRAADVADGVVNDMHGNSGFLHASGWTYWPMLPAIQHGSTKAYFWVPADPSVSYLALMRSADASNQPGTGRPYRPNNWPIVDNSNIEGTFNYFTP